LLRVLGDSGLNYRGGGLSPRPGQLSWHLVGSDSLNQPVYGYTTSSGRGD
jgi:hypothetical protein